MGYSERTTSGARNQTVGAVKPDENSAAGKFGSNASVTHSDFLQFIPSCAGQTRAKGRSRMASGDFFDCRGDDDTEQPIFPFQMDTRTAWFVMYSD